MQYASGMGGGDGKSDVAWHVMADPLDMDLSAWRRERKEKYSEYVEREETARVPLGRVSKPKEDLEAVRTPM